MFDILQLLFELGENGALVFCLVSIYSFTLMRRPTQSPALSAAMIGLLFGGVALVSMRFPVHILPEVVINSGVMIVSLAGLFGGPIAAAIATVLPSMFRVIQGGLGILSDVGALVSGGLLGVFFHHRWSIARQQPSTAALFFFGGLTAVQALLWSFFLPLELAWAALKIYALPIGLLSPPITALIGTLLFNERERTETLAQLFTKKEMVVQQAHELQESAQRLRVHLEHTPLGVIEWDRNFHVTSWNSSAEMIFGFSRAEALGKSGPELIVPEELRGDVSPIWSDLINGEGGHQITRENNNKVGDIILCDWYNMPLRDKAGAVIGVLSLVHDVTEKTQAINEQERLRESMIQAQKMEAIGTLAGGVAHDFNNMLAGILTSAEVLALQEANDELGAELIHVIIDASNRAAELTRQLLLFSRGSSEKKQPVDLHQVIANVVSFLERCIDKNIFIEVDLNASSSVTLADTSQLENALINLGINARDAMPNGGVLRFTTENTAIKDDVRRSAGEYLRLSVKDTGSGMSLAVRERIFEPFFTTKGLGQGTGLGLATVYGIIQDHAGSVSVESREGEGTDFTILLPTCDQKISEQEPPHCQEHSAKRSGRVLIVDDEEVVRQTAAALFRELGYEPQLACDGKSGLDIALKQQGEFDLILLDLMMPGLTGREVTQRLRADGCQTPIIIISGYAGEEDPEDLIKAGAQAYLPKPFRLKNIAQIVQNVVAPRRAPVQRSK